MNLYYVMLSITRTNGSQNSKFLCVSDKISTFNYQLLLILLLAVSIYQFIREVRQI